MASPVFQTSNENISFTCLEFEWLEAYNQNLNRQNSRRIALEKLVDNFKLKKGPLDREKSKNWGSNNATTVCEKQLNPG